MLRSNLAVRGQHGIIDLRTLLHMLHSAMSSLHTYIMRLCDCAVQESKLKAMALRSNLAVRGPGDGEHVLYRCVPAAASYAI
jgi:hypothetical protein